MQRNNFKVRCGTCTHCHIVNETNDINSSLGICYVYPPGLYNDNRVNKDDSIRERYVSLNDKCGQWRWRPLKGFIMVTIGTILTIVLFIAAGLSIYSNLQ